jgi:hypothetical protein
MTPTKTPRIARALAPLFAATALVSIPAFAQDATPQTTQPVVTPPQTATVPIPPVVRTVPDGATAAAPAAADEQAAPAPVARAPRSTTTRSTATRIVTRTPAPVKAAPVPQPAAAPAPQPVAATPPAPEAAAPAPAPATDTAAPSDTALNGDAKSAATTQTTTTSGGIPTWALVAGAIAVLAIIIGAIAALRRRREDEEVYYDEPTYVEEPYVEPVAAAPIAAAPRKEPEYLRAAEPVGSIEPVAAAADDVEVTKVDESEIAELTGGAPVAERPWLEFAMRPVRAGTNVDEALVEIELTVGNAGSVSAKDVRISTFLLSSDPNGTEMERLLVQPPVEATTDPVTIQPGEGTRVDATLALLKADMGEDLPASFRPIVVADARYTLADGSEGRTSASFEIGVEPEEGGSLEPIELARASMHDNVAAELHGEPVHA